MKETRYLTKLYCAPREKRGETSTFEAVSLNEDDYTFSGAASVYGALDSYGDVMLAGAFAGNDAKNVKMFFNHRSDGIPIGKFTAFRDEGDRFFVDGVLTRGVALAEDLRLAMRAKTIDGLSVGGYATGIKNATGGLDIEKFQLVEISIVTFPAVTDARIKSHDQTARIQRALDSLLTTLKG